MEGVGEWGGSGRAGHLACGPRQAGWSRRTSPKLFSNKLLSAMGRVKNTEAVMGRGNHPSRKQRHHTPLQRLAGTVHTSAGAHPISVYM